MLFRGVRGGSSAAKAGEKTPLLGAGARRSDDAADVKPPTKKTAEESSSFGDYAGKTLEGTSQILTIGALVFTGIYFLPPLLTKQMSDALFPFIPEEYRPLASGASSCCSCICVVICLVVVLMSMADE
jgi:hypothetical protein